MCWQVLKKISKYIQEQNEKIYAPRGLLLTDPLERGMRVVSSGQWGVGGMTRVRGGGTLRAGAGQLDLRLAHPTDDP